MSSSPRPRGPLRRVSRIDGAASSRHRDGSHDKGDANDGIVGEDESTADHPTSGRDITRSSGNALVSLRTFMLIVVSLVVAVSAGALAYWHKPWVIVGAASFAAALKFLNDHVE